jgi:4-diphosphocytidyl-2-C-methyl-D-erythritol kinase
MTIVREFAPAKVNLTLEVLGRRADGYHELNSLVAFASVGDHVTLDTSKPVGTSVTGPFGMTIAGANLIDVTLAKLAAAEPRLQLGHVTLEKQLPIAAGIGGGSADAAAVLRAVRRVNPALVDAVDWNAIAVSLGADVPVCLASRLSWMRGLGERVLPLEAAEAINLPALIVNPLAPVPADKTAHWPPRPWDRNVQRPQQIGHGGMKPLCVHLFARAATICKRPRAASCR